MSIRRRMPPEYVPTRRSAACSRSNSPSSSSARDRAADLLSPCSRPNITRFSRPVSMSSRATCCPVSMIDRRTAGRVRDDVVTGELAVPRSGLVERRQHVDRRRLAGAVGPEHATHLAAADLEADAAHRLNVDRTTCRFLSTTTLFSELVNPVSPVLLLCRRCGCTIVITSLRRQVH